MWRAINSIGRGFRSVRPSQWCSQDCCDEEPNKYYNQSYHCCYNEASKVHAAALRYYSTASWWSPLTIRRNDNSLRGITCSSAQIVYLYHSSFPKVGEGIHTGLYDNGGQITERRDGANYHPRCPPWHWNILQDSQKLEKCSSEEEEREEKQNTGNWRKTCHSQEWKEILQSSPTLHALGWGSAAALTLSLYHVWSEQHPCPYINRVRKKYNSDPKDIKEQDQKNEENWNYHKPFKDFFSNENNSHKVSSESADAEDYHKNCVGEMYEVPNFQYKFQSTMFYDPNLVKSYECQTPETTVPLYSLQQKFLDVARKVFGTQENNHVNGVNKLEEICQDEPALHAVNESPFPLQDEWSNVLGKKDSECISDFSQSFQSQTCCTKLEIPQSQYSQNEESSVSKPVSVIGPESPVTKALESELPAEEEEDVSKHSQDTGQKEPVINYTENTKMKMLHERLLEVVKANHEERLSDMLKKDEKALFNNKPEEMVIYFQAGMLMGDTTSTFNLALCYHMGHGVAQDLENARKLYAAASAAGHGWATYNLAVMLSQGLGGPFLPQKAHSLLLQAAKMGVKEAQEALSVLEEEKQLQTPLQEEEDEPRLRRCYSESSLLPSHAQEWPSSYSTGDLLSLLDEDDQTVGLPTVSDVAQKTQLF